MALFRKSTGDRLNIGLRRGVCWDCSSGCRELLTKVGQSQLWGMVTATRTKIIGKVIALAFCGVGLAACYASVQTGPTEEYDDVPQPA